jgi:hypothetical protein
MPHHKLWTMQGGATIQIRKMETSHLRNTIKMLERRAEHQHASLIKFALSCPTPNGEMAEEEFERGFDQMLDATFEDYLPDIYYDLEEELEKREQSSKTPRS